MFITIGGMVIYFICKRKCFPQPDTLEIIEPESAFKSSTKKIVFGPAVLVKEKLKITADEEKLSRKYFRCKMADPELQSYQVYQARGKSRKTQVKNDIKGSMAKGIMDKIKAKSTSLDNLVVTDVPKNNALQN